MRHVYGFAILIGGFAAAGWIWLAGCLTFFGDPPPPECEPATVGALVIALVTLILFIRAMLGRPPFRR